MTKWITGVLTTIVAGVVIYWLTVGLTEPPISPPTPTPTPAPTPQPTPTPKEQKVPGTYNFSMFQLNKLGGGDCEMDTDPQDTVTVNFSSALRYSRREVSLAVNYDAKEYKGNGTKIGKRTTETVYKAPSGKHIVDLDYKGTSKFTISDYGAQGRNHGFRSFGDLIRNSYWQRLEYKVDDRGGNDCAVAGVKGTLAFTVTLRKSR